MIDHHGQSGGPGIEARVAARWWAGKIRNGFWPDAGGRSGDIVATPEAQGLIGLSREAAMRDVTPEKVDAYESALAVEVQRMLDDGLSSYATACELGCDYGPSGAHRRALATAGIKPLSTVLPWKTTMWVQPGSVRVGDGYGAAPEPLSLEEI